MIRNSYSMKFVNKKKRYKTYILYLPQYSLANVYILLNSPQQKEENTEYIWRKLYQNGQIVNALNT